MAALEIWRSAAPVPATTVDVACRAEEDGFDGLVFTDSQNLAGDPYVALALAAHATSRITLATGVTNPVTRHPAVTACAIASVQAESNGRAELGIGRGDSALAYIGRDPAPAGVLERYVQRLQTYLRGEDVDIDGYASRLRWLRHVHQPKVPVHVAATGPRVLALAARHADRVMFALGADVDRLRWGIETVRKARAAAGLDPDGVRLGAYVTAVVHPDAATAREMARGSVGVFAHFQGMPHAPTEHLPAEDRAVAEGLRAHYDMRNHAASKSGHAATLTDEYVDRSAAVGPPEHVIERLRPLAALGLDRLIVATGSRDTDPRLARESVLLFLREVLPELRRAAG